MSKVAGCIYEATPDGFRRLLQEANRVAQDGYELLTIVPLGEEHLACVFKRDVGAVPVADVGHDSFFE